MKNLLTVAGSDSCGGAGIQADLKTFAAHGGYGMSVITAVTAQNTKGVFGIEQLSPDIIKAQAKAVFDDIPVDGVKIGMLGSREAAEAVADILDEYNPKLVIVDPVMVSTSGSELMTGGAEEILIRRILPAARMVTPNIPEAEAMSGIKIKTIQDMGKAAQIIGDMGPAYVLIKGGHLRSSSDDLLYNGRTMTIFEGKRINSKSTHGTGCTLSSAICANMARGMDAVMAVGEAKKYIETGIANAPKLGGGHGPIHHFYSLWKTSEPNVETTFKVKEKE